MTHASVVMKKAQDTEIRTNWSVQDKRAIELLGTGLGNTVVAQAIGVTESRIAQLMSTDSFRAEVMQLRFENLQRHNVTDARYDDMESRVLTQLEDNLPLVQKPMELVRILATLNNAKRRGSEHIDTNSTQSNIVTLLMPTMITQQFTTNINNQVIVAGEQTLETIQGSTLLNAAKQKTKEIRNELPHTLSNPISTTNTTDTE